MLMKRAEVILAAMISSTLAAAECSGEAQSPDIVDPKAGLPWRHPWYVVPPDLAAVNTLKKRVAPLLDMPDEKIAALVPARRPIGDTSLANMGPEYRGKLGWTPRVPQHLSIGGMSFIPEERFTIPEVTKVTGPDGTEWEYEYAVNKAGKRVYVTSVRDAVARDWLMRAAKTLSTLYAATGDTAYARKAAVIVAQFAAVYPGYPIYGKTSSKGKSMFFHKEPYPVHTGKWGSWYPVELKLIEPLVLAYDAIRSSGVIEDLSQAWKRDLRQEIETDFLLDNCRLIQRYDKWHANTLAFRTHNVQPYKCRAMIAIGRTIERPELVHYAYSFVKEAIDRRIGLDGVFPESPSYHGQMIGNLGTALKYLEGYTDPTGYVDPLTKRRFDNVDPAVEFPTFAKATEFQRESAFPDGRVLMVHDTWPRQHAHFKRTHTTSRIWPVFGHAVLGRGRDAAQMEAHLNYGPDFGHGHQDTLNLILWACGEELLSDVGYTYTYRGWARGALAHNLVVVDGMNQETGGFSVINTPHDTVGGRITCWAPIKDGFGVIEAEDVKSYPQCSTYRRTIMLVEDNETNAFVVDVFDVIGGSQHDFLAHGSADKDQRLTFDKPLTSFADSLAADGKIKLPTPTRAYYGTSDVGKDFDKYGVLSQYWGNIRHVRQTQGPGPWQGTFSGSAPTDARLRMHLLAPIDCELYAGEAPSIRRAEEDTSKIENYMMPILTARRRGTNLTSRYVVVWEPYQPEPWLHDVRLGHASGDGIVVEARTDNARYRVFWSPADAEGLAHDGAQFSGRFACLREAGDNCRVAMVDGHRFRAGGIDIQCHPAPMLTVCAAGADDDGDYLQVEGNIPTSQRDEQWGILIYPGGDTRAIRLRLGKGPGVLRCPDGHGLTAEADGATWREIYSPGRVFKGNIRLRLINRLASGGQSG